jgi:hypothetical protein
MRSGSVGFIVKVKKRASGSERRLADVRCGAEERTRRKDTFLGRYKWSAFRPDLEAMI